MYTHIVVHYAEIGLKGKNITAFVDLLSTNIQNKVTCQVRRESGALILTLDDPKSAISALQTIPGIAHFHLAVKTSHEQSEMEKAACALVKEEEYSSFRVTAKRMDKNNQLRSMDVARQVGSAIVTAYDKKVDLHNPDLNVQIEIVKDYAFVGAKTYSGVGGLPTDSKKKVIVLLSGGFDSPVAAYLMMKRGCTVTFVHFQNEHQMSDSVEGKIHELAEQLSQYQQETTLHIIPFGKLQNEIIEHVRAPDRMMIYRRFMTKLAAMLAHEEHVKFLVTGDSLSQVASQTINNLFTLYSLSELPILAPLIGTDKKEIMDIARQIGTYDLSKQPYGDCCSFFLPKHPNLRMHTKQVASVEKHIAEEFLLSVLEEKKTTVYGGSNE